jgi:hypothetical protein
MHPWGERLFRQRAGQDHRGMSACCACQR